MLQTDLDGKVTIIDKKVVLSFDSNQSLHLYPIPARNKLFVQLDMADYSTTTYRIYDVLSHVVATGNIDKTRDDSIHQIDISDLVKGVYYLSIGESFSQGEMFLKE